MESLFNLFDVSKVRNIGIITHSNGDPDAVCGAIALETLIKKKMPEKNIFVLIDKYNEMSDNIISKKSLRILNEIPKQNIDLIILFDVNTVELLCIFQKLVTPEVEKIVIDHHSRYPGLLDLTDNLIIQEDYTSATELIYDQFILNEINIDPSVACLLLLGIMFDSKHLTIANHVTLKKTAHLCELGANLEEAKALLSRPMDYSEKIARIKAAQRSSLEKINNWVIAFSHVSSFEASACRGLLELGADVAFVYAVEKDEVGVSCRASKDFEVKTKFNLGEEIMRPLGEFIGGTGGGHAAAAACRGKKNADKIEAKIKELLKNKLGN